MKTEELINIIEKYYGFKKELICDVSQCGLWHVRFTVNGIKYYGCVSHAGAEPQLFIEGYTYKHYWKGTPVTEEYYKEFIEGQTIQLIRYTDPESGDWAYQEETFSTPEEAEAYIKTLDNPKMYTYDIRYD